MLRDLACLFPEMLDALAEADHTYLAETGERLGDRAGARRGLPASGQR
jgi:hypothetical protein